MKPPGLRASWGWNCSFTIATTDTARTRRPAIGKRCGGADIVVMVHPDYQYDPTLLPEIIRPIQDGNADVVLGSRLMGLSPMRQGMPWWKYYSNRFLTMFENLTFGLKLSEYHTGYRAFRREVLECVNLEMNSDNFIFDQEILAQIVSLDMRIAEHPVPTRYFAQASSASFLQSSVYGLSILWLLARYWMHRAGIMHQRQFDSLERRYRSKGAPAARDNRQASANPTWSSRLSRAVIRRGRHRGRRRSSRRARPRCFRPAHFQSSSRSR